MPEPNPHVGRLGRRPPEDPVLGACREWYAGVVSTPPSNAAQVKASWDARFHPVAFRLTRRPTKAEREASPGRFFFSPRHDCRGRFTGEGWWGIAPLVPPTAAEIDEARAARGTREPRPLARGSLHVLMYAGGLYVATRDGRIVQDRDEAMDLPVVDDPTEGEMARMVRRFMPTSRGPSPVDPTRRSRKRREVPTTARALALALMVPRLGAREATRELLRWDQRLEAPGRSVRGGELASKYGEQVLGDQALVDTEPDDLDAEETALLRSARRVWQALGIEIEGASRP
jgi:hypothetical protein